MGFKRHLESLGIKLITSRIKHPQTNGKIEKLFLTATTGTETILMACRLPVEAMLGVAFNDEVVGNERYIKSKISGLHKFIISSVSYNEVKGEWMERRWERR